jgi:hypothetical protein
VFLFFIYVNIQNVVNPIFLRIRDYLKIFFDTPKVKNERNVKKRQLLFWKIDGKFMFLTVELNHKS